MGMSSELFSFFGGAALFTFIAALSGPGGIDGPSRWVVALPALIAAVAMLVVDFRRLRGCSVVLQREERLLRIAEQCVLFLVIVALGGLVSLLALCKEDFEGIVSHCTSTSGNSAAAAGVGICILALIRSRMALVECRLGGVDERMISWRVAAGSRYHGQNGEVNPSAGPAPPPLPVENTGIAAGALLAAE